jgi:hypothetical protein
LISAQSSTLISLPTDICAKFFNSSLLLASILHTLNLSLGFPPLSASSDAYLSPQAQEGNHRAEQFGATTDSGAPKSAMLPGAWPDSYRLSQPHFLFHKQGLPLCPIWVRYLHVCPHSQLHPLLYQLSTNYHPPDLPVFASLIISRRRCYFV